MTDEEKKERMDLIKQYVDRDFPLGEKDRGFALYLLTDFFEFLDSNNLKLVESD